MTDRELLELAAKAYGIDHWYGREGTIEWNPLEDDGDAFRLALKLKLSISNNDPANKYAFVFVELADGTGCWNENVTSEALRAASARRAITRAAAEIGKGME